MAQNVKTVQGLAIASVKTVQGLAIASAKTIMGVDNTSGSPTWSDSLAGASTDTSESFGSSASGRQVVSNTVAGTCSKLRIWCRSGNASAMDLKAALYDSSFNKLGQGTASFGSGVSSGTWMEVTLDSSVAGITVTTYYIGFCPSNNTSQPGYKDVTGNALIDFGVAYAAFPTDPFNTADNVTWTYAVGMLVTP